VLALALAASIGSPAANVRSWAPGDIVPTTASLPTMELALRQPTLAGTQYVIHIHLNAKDTALETTALVRGGDFRLTTTIDGSTYESGRADGVRWRRTPAGVVRIVDADVQGDDLDRWPSSVLGFDLSDCAAAGQAREEGRLLWILSCHTPADIPHWYYIDSTAGTIVREVTREGSRAVTYRFAGIASRAGRLFPARWDISGAGGDAEASILDISQMPVSRDDVAIPPSVSAQFVLPAAGTADVSATFSQASIYAPVRVNGRAMRFRIDTGTTQTLMDIGAAVRLGLHPVLGHAIANTIEVGGAIARDAPIQTVDLFGGGDAGILGNEFFTGHIVHIDYRHQQMQLISYARFVPPSDARSIPLDMREGMPLATASIGSLTAGRFAIDTGSYWIVVTTNFQQLAGASVHLSADGPALTSTYLEGSVKLSDGTIESLSFGGVRVNGPEAQIEIADPNNLDIPLNGIFGNQLLHVFEWWFDYDHDRAWIRFAP